MKLLDKLFGVKKNPISAIMYCPICEKMKPDNGWESCDDCFKEKEKEE